MQTNETVFLAKLIEVPRETSLELVRVEIVKLCVNLVQLSELKADKLFLLYSRLLLSFN